VELYRVPSRKLWVSAANVTVALTLMGQDVQHTSLQEEVRYVNGIYFFEDPV
jgi:hypothetical protein